MFNKLKPSWVGEVEIPQDKLLGAVFCHGRKHVPIPKDFQYDDTFWIYIDINDDKNPDIVADVTDNSLVELLGSSSLNYIIFLNCPFALTSTRSDFYENNILQVAFNLLAPGGVLYWMRGVSSLFRYSIKQLISKGTIQLYDSRINISDIVAEQLDYVQNKYGFSSYTIIEKLPVDRREVLCLIK